MATDADLVEEMRTSLEKCRKWMGTFAELPDAANHLRQLIDTAVALTIEDCIAVCTKVAEGERCKIGESRSTTRHDHTQWGATMCADGLRALLHKSGDGT
jgi:hypothetical protein